MSFWGRYVPVAERRAKAMRQMNKLRKQGLNVQPVTIGGRTIASSFWGKGWCDHLESFSDYANRLPRGRTYARNGSVCHLDIQPGRIDAIVSGSQLYHVTLHIKKLKTNAWLEIKAQCAGHIGSMLELLQGKLSDQVMRIVTDPQHGLFPQPDEIELSCDCPDWAVMCKHVAAVLYGVGNRLDQQPALLFLLRAVDAEELIAAEMSLPEIDTPGAEALADDQLGDIFGIDMDTQTDIKPATKKTAKEPHRKSEKVASRTKRQRRAASEQPTTTSPALKPTGKSIARLRQQQQLSVAQFAQQLGVAPASVYRWEDTPGRLTLQQRTLDALEAFYQKCRQ